MNYMIKSHKLEVVSLINFCESVQTVDFNDSIPRAHAYTLMFCCSKMFSGVFMWQLKNILQDFCVFCMFYLYYLLI